MKVGKVKAFFGGVNLVVSLREMSVESARGINSFSLMTVMIK